MRAVTGQCPTSSDLASLSSAELQALLAEKDRLIAEHERVIADNQRRLKEKDKLVKLLEEELRLAKQRRFGAAARQLQPVAVRRH